MNKQEVTMNKLNLDGIEFPNLTEQEFEEIIEGIYQIKLKIQNGDFDLEELNFDAPLVIMPIVADIISKENVTKEQLREEWSWVMDEEKFNDRISRLKEEYFNLKNILNNENK